MWTCGAHLQHRRPRWGTFERSAINNSEPASSTARTLTIDIATATKTLRLKTCSSFTEMFNLLTPKTSPTPPSHRHVIFSSVSSPTEFVAPSMMNSASSQTPSGNA